MEQALEKVDDFPPQTLADEAKPGWLLRELKPKHKLVCVLLSQGMKNVEVAKHVQITPEYVSMLLRQPIIKAEVGRLSDIAATNLEALFPKAVDVISDVLTHGNDGDRLKAVRLQMEATHRIGRPDPLAGQIAPSDDRLEQLAQRIVSLNQKAKRRAENETAEEVSYEEVGMERPVLEGTYTEVGRKLSNGSADQDG